MLVNSGAEAMENAIKIARKYTKTKRNHRFHRRFPRQNQPDHGHDQ
jgi:acetylornithine/succinyldiaminopimelate/putrescine aminotransferase